MPMESAYIHATSSCIVTAIPFRQGKPLSYAGRRFSMSRYAWGISNRLSPVFLQRAMVLMPTTSLTRRRKTLRTLRGLRI